MNILLAIVKKSFKVFKWLFMAVIQMIELGYLKLFLWRLRLCFGLLLRVYLVIFRLNPIKALLNNPHSKEQGQLQVNSFNRLKI